MRNRTPAVLALIAVLSAVPALRPGTAHAEDLPLIRDSEIEHTLRRYSHPLFRAAGLKPQAIEIHLVNKDSLNAFVTPGRHMFVHTGLLRRSKGPLEVMGVIAHEAGHIASGDIAGRRQARAKTTTGAVASALLGIGAAMLTGRSEVGLALSQVGQGAAISNLLAYTRAQEGTADQAAVSYLNEAGYSPRGLVSFMKTLEGQTALLPESQAPFLRTHPLTSERIDFLQRAVKKSPHRNKPVPQRLKRMHARMVAKLDGFLKPPRRVLRQYAGESTVPARYARAIARFRDADLEQALTLVDGLIAEQPKDPYFHELKGQMLFEHGRVRDALGPYSRAVKLAPTQPLLRLGLAEVQLRTKTRANTEKALDNLKQVLDVMQDNPFAWRLAATAYGRLGQKGRTALALAEAALASGDAKTAHRQAKRAQQRLTDTSTAWQQARDVANEAKRQLQRSNG